MTTDDDAILVLENVGVARNGQPILAGIDATFQRGLVHAVVGPNGAGKSTLAAVIMGLEGYREATTGVIRYEGAVIEQLDVTERARRGIALAWQEPARFEGLRIGRLLEASGASSDDEVDAALHDAGLEPDRYRQRAADTTLSGGERKKLELASIMVMRPRFVMLDEPDSGIDVASLDHIFAALATLQERETTVVLITHSPTVLRHAERAMLMCCGTIVDRGDAERIGREFASGCIPCPHHPRQVAGHDTRRAS